MQLQKKINYLPETIEELTKFILFGREKLNVVRAQIKAMENLEVAHGVTQQKKDEAQMLAEALIDAEAKLGDLFIKIPKAINQYKSASNNGVTTKEQATKGLGFDKMQVSRLETLAKNKDLIKVAKKDARDNDDLVTRSEVLRLAKEREKQITKENKKDEFKKYASNFRSDEIKIIHGDFRKQNIEDNSIDLILTDPPYPGEYLPLWQDLFDLAINVLKPSSFLIAYSGQMYLDKIFKMKNDLIYYWTANIVFTQKPLIQGRNIINEWKPILFFQKPPFKKISDTISDTISFNYSERDMHENNWGQTVKPFEFLIDKFSNPNDLIFEPFAGTGTTLIAAKNMKRRCLGIEIDKQYIDLIKGRLA